MMFHYKKDIYDMCTLTSNRAMHLFCNEINNSDADVFIIMAHKAVQLFYVLLDQNHINKEVRQKKIISSQALDFDCHYLAGKKIAIIDDIIISGTSIASVVNKLLEIGVLSSNISIIGLAIDRYYQTMRFDNYEGKSVLFCNTTLDDDACIELSYNISQIFSYYGLPYDVDFPSYDSIPLNENEINLFYNDLFWDLEVVTNFSQQAGGVTTFSLFPKQAVREMLWDRIGINLEKIAHFKLRVYVRQFPSGRKECSVIPMCLFNGVSESNVDVICSLCDPENQVVLFDKNYIAKIKFLQFFLAHQLYLAFIKVSSLFGNVEPYEHSVRLLFGTCDGPKVIKALSIKRENHSPNMWIESTDCVNKDLVQAYQDYQLNNKWHNLGEFFGDEGEITDWLINYAILSPFIWWYDTKEIPSRRELKMSGRHYIRDFIEFEPKLARLNTGFSLKTLQYLLKDTLANYASQTVISIFLDRAIDEGIIVPTICHNEDSHFLCRAYRHGEDLPFGLEDECRLLYFLDQLSKKLSEGTNPILADGIAEITFEKMIVLFYEMGIKQGGIFNRFLGFNNIKLLKPFLSLHGRIQGFIDPHLMDNLKIKREHIYSESDNNGNRYITWLTSWLKVNGFVTHFLEGKPAPKRDIYYINTEKIHEYLTENERSCISSIIKGRISNIAGIIAYWYKQMAISGCKDKFKEDSIALTSCSDVYVYASAIATEIHYFSNYWTNQVHKAFLNPCNYNEIKYKLTESEDDKRYTADIQQGLNSGRNKVTWFESKRALEVVKKVSELLEKTDNCWAALWNTLWDSVESAEYSAGILLRRYTHQAIGFLFFYSACYDCLRSNSFWESGEKPSSYEYYKTNFESHRVSADGLLNGDWFLKLDSIILLNDFNKKLFEFNNLVRYALSLSEDTVKNIELEVERGAQNYTIMYSSSLIVDIKAIDIAHINSKMMRVWDQIVDVDKTQLNIVHFDDEDLDFVRYGFFYGINSANKELDTSQCASILISLYKNICNEFNGQVYEIRAILLPHTPVGRMFKHNVQRNIRQYTAEFTCQIIDVLKSCFRSDAKEQLILGITDSVNMEIVNEVNKIGWTSYTDSVKSTHLDQKDLFALIALYCNGYSKNEPSGKRDITYSSVMIECGERVGAGVLIRTNSRVVCVTCSHILNEYPNKTIRATSMYGNEITFLLKPIKKGRPNTDSNYLSAASEELSILVPLWNGRIPLDVTCLLEHENLNIDLNSYSNKDCRICSFSNQVDLVWHDSLKMIGRSSKGYYQIGGAIETLSQGCSGGSIVLAEKPDLFIGIHKGRFEGEKFGHMIPCTLIYAELQKVEEMIKCQEQEN